MCTFTWAATGVVYTSTVAQFADTLFTHPKVNYINLKSIPSYNTQHTATVLKGFIYVCTKVAVSATVHNTDLHDQQVCVSSTELQSAHTYV